MRALSILLTSIAALFASCGGSDETIYGPERVARAYIEAFCRQDGSHTQLEFERSELPEKLLAGSATLMDMPRGVAIVRIDQERVSYMAPGEDAELARSAVRFIDVLGREQTVSELRLQLQVQFINARIHHAILSVRPDIPFDTGGVTDVTLEQDWRVIPAKVE